MGLSCPEVEPASRSLLAASAAATALGHSTLRLVGIPSRGRTVGSCIRRLSSRRRCHRTIVAGGAVLRGDHARGARGCRRRCRGGGLCRGVPDKQKAGNGRCDEGAIEHENLSLLDGVWNGRNIEAANDGTFGVGPMSSRGVAYGDAVSARRCACPTATKHRPPVRQEQLQRAGSIRPGPHRRAQRE